MRYSNVAIPAGFAWSSPFTKWQGALAEVSSLDLAADVTARALADRGLDPAAIEEMILGWTVPSPTSSMARHCSPPRSAQPG